ncbi:uncharacterized membrane protein YcaP (DUF421 family) [Peribacillus deserti]|uniref:Uncharacterized membrane protein YcaP (DUF421 family) n=1 Tax=Peribacillus deserti TaxID=673318 RepID=A0ABS2QE90_9BACI|nr:DUF421 domain-containing protein [Peribacillus deserti]MBM7691300.1 uncharacterized membrane protein YcaP (DUF421 family) [Peribacillus deserti]
MPSYLDVVVRSLLYIAVLFFFTKLTGKKQLSQLSFFDYVSGITIGSIAGEVMMGLEKHYFHGVISIAIFSLFTLLVDRLSVKSKWIGDMVEGTGTVFIQNGKILEENLKKENISLKELSALLRKKSVFNFSDVEFAVLEPPGDLSILLKSDKQPLTPSDIGLITKPVKQPYTIISDGKVLPKSLSEAGKDLQWLDQTLNEWQVALDQVFYLQINTKGEVEIDLYDDKKELSMPKQS